VTVPTVSTLDGPGGTDDEAAQLHELADRWRVTPEEAPRPVNGIDMELQIKAHDDEQPVLACSSIDSGLRG